MGSSSGRKSGSSGRSSSRKRVVIGAEETTRVRYKKDRPEVESERKRTPRQSQRAASERATDKGPKPSGAGRRIAAEKRDDRDRRRRSQARKRFGLGVLGVALVIGLVWGLVALWNAPIFTASDIQITGLRHISRSEILKLASISPDERLPSLPKAAIEKRIASSPWVSEVHVTRQFPHTVNIAVVERTTAAVVDAGGTSLWLISADGHWLAPRTSEVTTALVAIRDVPSPQPVTGALSGSPELQNALQVLAGLSPKMRSKLKAISAPSIETTELILNGDVRVMVGSSEDIAKKDAVALAIIAANKNVVYVNVRVPERATERGLNQGK